MAAEDYFPDLWDDSEWMTLGPSCKHCGKQDLVEWVHVRVNGKMKWKLMESNGNWHDCLNRPATANEFEDLTK